MKLSVLCATTLVATVASAADCPVRDHWPTDEWRSRIEDVAPKKQAETAALEQYAFTRTGADAERKGIRTDAVLVIHDGAVIYEKYAPGWTAQKRHLTWSASKSVTSALTGIATAKAGLDVTKSICDWITSPRAEHCDITVQHMLWMSSGLQWQEVYEGQSNQASSVLSMLYGIGNKDVPQFVLDHDRRAAPGTRHSYSSGETNVLMAIVDTAMKRNAGAAAEWPWKELFDPIGMKRVTLERDQKGNMLGSSYVYATPRDFAKFGYLYLNDGCWNGTRIVPEGWVAASQVETPATEKEDPEDSYGYQWWLNTPNAAAKGGRAWPSIPGDAYAARGHWGQSMTIIPSKNTIILRFADDRDDTFDSDTFLKLALALVEAP